ncbi:MAG: esterase, partial [Lachnospiraceae bacterium]|nr:esterase [Lachnospiraceae bacterium]
LIKQNTKEDSILLIAIITDSWNDDLSPWASPPVFGKDPFSGKGEDTLHGLINEILPSVSKSHGLSDQTTKYILGGYSLAGLFSLWSVYRTDFFSACAAISPSVWFKGWTEYATANDILTDIIYLSLGTREEKTKNRLMSTVGDNIRLQAELLKDKNCLLEWNAGNHFTDPVLRTVKGFSHCISVLRDQAL